MRILDWNVCSFCKNQLKVIQKALSFEADIMCLQEVTNESLIVLKNTQGYEIAYTNDAESDNDVYGNKGGCYIAILSKYPILATGTIEYYNKRINSPTVRFLNWYSKESERHRALYVDLLIDDAVVRLYNIHISWAVTPSVRVEQFTNFYNVVNEYAKIKIICGDLNVFGGLKYYNVLVSILFGYKRKDILFDERKWFDDRIEELALQNPFKNTISWPLIPFNAQLDHILVPNNAEIVSAYQPKETFGSDHTPYVLDVTL